MMRWVPAALFASICALSTPVLAEDTKLEVELNKLEPMDSACRAYFVVNNPATTEYETLKLDLVLFGADGVIWRRLLVNLGPLKGEKRVVKQFDLEGTACDQVGSLLVNDVPECKSASGPVTDCIAGLSLKSLTKVPFSK